MANIERKLASVQRVDWVRPIEGADNIELVGIKGWQCVAKKGEFQKGDLCIYFEIDSFLPVEPRYEFLRKGCYKNVEGLGEGFRIRTIKLRGVLSQGLAIPVDTSLYAEGELPAVGDDLTEVLGVKKYEKPIPYALRGKVKGNFPIFIPRTDQERVQNIIQTLEDDDDMYEVTLKLDGSSMTCFVKDGEVGVCSRNLQLKIEDNEGNAFVETFKKLKIDKMLLDFHEATGRNIALQGELMGPGVQGNREDLPELTFFLFDIFDIDKQEYMLPEDRWGVKETWFSSLEEAPMVVFPQRIRKWVEGNLLDGLLQFADRKSLFHPIAEGLVFKSITVPGKSFKVINNKYLLKEK